MQFFLYGLKLISNKPLRNKKFRQKKLSWKNQLEDFKTENKSSIFHLLLTFQTLTMRSSLVLYCLTSLVALASITPALGYPSSELTNEDDLRASQGRKFAEKPNSTKKLTLLEDRNDLEDLATNQLTVSCRHFVLIF